MTTRKTRNMPKTGRNDACPCGSGLKYKRCCLRLHEAAAAERARLLSTPTESHVIDAEMDELDTLSHQASDLIRAARLDDAQRIAEDLIRRFPDQVDGLERMAEAFEARGDTKRAADYFRKAAAFTLDAEGFDPEVANMFRQRADDLDPPRD